MSVTETFCVIDDFCIALFTESEKSKCLEGGNETFRDRPEKLSLSERMTIIILFHQIGYREKLALRFQTELILSDPSQFCPTTGINSV